MKKQVVGGVSPEELPPTKKRHGRQPKVLNKERITTLRAQGLTWNAIAARLRVAPVTIYKTGLPKELPPLALSGRPKKILDHRKLEKISDPEIESPLVAMESLLIFDSRCLDRETRQELLRLIPQLVLIRRAWKAEYMECGCTSCHKKKEGYGAGGFCNACWGRIYNRMRIRYRKLMEGRDLTAELETFRDALALRYNAAQQLFNSDEE